ncbi:MAG: nucleotidyltransferase family protein [Clostridiales bacterium]|nr:nucleotidyltransferase family protein [Clostridiales bacterium]
MSKEFRLLFSAICAAAQGREFHIAEDVDWKQLLTLLREQSVPALATRALAFAPAGVPDAVRAWAKQQYMFLSAKEGYRRGEALRLLERLEDAGFSPVVLKGFAVGAHYAAPDCRISGDIDILVPLAEETPLCEFLAQNEGCSVDPRALGNHSIVRHPALGTIEVHVSLFAEDNSEEWFIGHGKEPQHPFARVETPEGSYRSLDARDHMLFLLLHGIKHFIGGGLILRNVVDCAVFFAANYENLDRPLLRATLEELRYDTLCDAFLYAAMDVGGFILPQATVERLQGDAARLSPLAEKLLTDLEEHVYLREDENFSRSRTGREFSRRRLGEAAYAQTKAKTRAQRRLRRIFPTRLQLSTEYPVLRKASLLLPAVWFIRSAKKLFRHEKANDNLEAQAHRLALFGEAGLFD